MWRLFITGSVQGMERGERATEQASIVSDLSRQSGTGGSQRQERERRIGRKRKGETRWEGSDRPAVEADGRIS